jgi:hypothetical protein
MIVSVAYVGALVLSSFAVSRRAGFGKGAYAFRHFGNWIVLFGLQLIVLGGGGHEPELSGLLLANLGVGLGR